MITWFVAVAVVATLAGVVALAAGLGGTFAPLERTGSRLLPSGDLSPQQLREVQFPRVVGGYDPVAVDALLERVAEQWQARLDTAVATAPAPSAAEVAARDVPPGGTTDEGLTQR